MTRPDRPLSLDIDVIGHPYPRITLPEGYQSGAPLPAVEPLPIWLVNVSPRVMAARPALEVFLVEPATPRRLFDGLETVHLRFPDREAAEATEPDLNLHMTPSDWAAECAETAIPMILPQGHGQ